MKINLPALFFLFLCLTNAHAQTSKSVPLPAEADAFKFFVIGDWGRNGEHHQQDVANVMGQAGDNFEPEFVINVGDNFYCCGVASTTDPQWQVSFENVYKAHSLNIPWYSILGNHDYHGNPQAQIDYSKVSQRWKMPARYFTNVQEGVRFVYLDTNPFNKKYVKNAHEYADVAQQDTKKQLAWLDSVLTTSPEVWKIVVGHHPVFSTGKHGHTPELIEQLKPILDKHHVQAYFCGHDHDLQHQQPADSGVAYFVSGAGSESRANKPDPAMTKFAKATSGYMAVAIKKDLMMIYAIDYKGNVIYKTSVKQK